MAYELALAKSIRINVLARPFEWIWFQDRFNPQATTPTLQLYATKNCTDQLRKVHGISVIKTKVVTQAGFCIATAWVKDKRGRTDESIGVVDARGEQGQAYGDAMMWAETKAKRRATLSICGLGMLDETELHSLGDYGHLTPGGRIMEDANKTPSKSQQQIIEERLRAAGVDIGHVVCVWDDATQTGYIDGDERILSRLRGSLLRPYWDPLLGKIIVTDEQWQAIRNKLAEQGIPCKQRGHNAGRIDSPNPQAYAGVAS